MNLYWKRLFGTLASTAKVESEYNNRSAEYRRYSQVAQSKELAEYNELFRRVKSPEFKENKRTLISRKYKDTQWYRDMTKFNKLDRNSELHQYYKILETQELKDYLAFKQKPEFVQLGQPKVVKASPELTRLKHFELSKEYKIYTRFHNSYILREYNELKEKVSNPEFKKNNDFWANKNRWETTKEYQLECRFLELDKNEDIRFYLKFKNGAFEQFDKYQKIFEDSFDGNTLKASDWTYGFAYGDPALVKVHSYANEQQANTGGKNVMVANGQLRIATKSKKLDAIAWHPEKGFVQKSYNFTADVINCRNSVFIKGGVFSAKIRIGGSHHVQHAFWLQSDSLTPRINIARFIDGEIEVGIHWSSKFETKYTSTRIKGLKINDYYIYTLVWTEKELIWYINNFEVFRTSNFTPTVPMAPVFNSFIPEGVKADEADFDVDYVRIYSIK